MQFELTLPDAPKSWIDVSIKVVSHRTKRMKDPRRMIPGMSRRCAAKTRMRRRKSRVKEAVTMPNGKSLCSVSLNTVAWGVLIVVPWNANL